VLLLLLMLLNLLPNRHPRLHRVLPELRAVLLPQEPLMPLVALKLPLPRQLMQPLLPVQLLLRLPMLVRCKYYFENPINSA
jgi:hypothetical protein